MFGLILFMLAAWTIVVLVLGVSMKWFIRGVVLILIGGILFWLTLAILGLFLPFIGLYLIGLLGAAIWHIQDHHGWATQPSTDQILDAFIENIFWPTRAWKYLNEDIFPKVKTFFESRS
jgi:hypothetical protein